MVVPQIHVVLYELVYTVEVSIQPVEEVGYPDDQIIDVIIKIPQVFKLENIAQKNAIKVEVLVNAIDKGKEDLDL